MRILSCKKAVVSSLYLSRNFNRTKIYFGEVEKNCLVKKLSRVMY